MLQKIEYLEEEKFPVDLKYKLPTEKEPVEMDYDEWKEQQARALLNTWALH